MMAVEDVLKLPTYHGEVVVWHEEIGVLNVDFRTAESVQKNRKLLQKLSRYRDSDSKRRVMCSFGVPRPVVAGVYARLRLELSSINEFRQVLQQIGLPPIGWVGE